MLRSDQHGYTEERGAVSTGPGPSAVPEADEQDRQTRHSLAAALLPTQSDSTLPQRPHQATTTSDSPSADSLKRIFEEKHSNHPGVWEELREAHDRVFSTIPASAPSYPVLSPHVETEPPIGRTMSKPSLHLSTRFWRFMTQRFGHRQAPQFMTQRLDHRQAPQLAISCRELYESLFCPTIHIEFNRGESYPDAERFKTHGADGFRHPVKAMIDVWTKPNLVSRHVAELYFEDLDSSNRRPVVYTLSSLPAYAIKTVDGRWSCNNNPTVENPLLLLPKLFAFNKFEIMEKSLDYDVIIGLDTILEHDLLGLRSRLALAAGHFRGPPPPVQGFQPEASNLAWTARQQSDQNFRYLDEQWRLACDDYARQKARTRAQQEAEERAHQHALGRAQELLVTRFGPGAYNHANNPEYTPAYQEAYIEVIGPAYREGYGRWYPYYQRVYAQMHPRPRSDDD